MARPSKLTPELLEKAKAYLSDDYDVIPSIQGLSLYLNLGRATLHVWRSQDIDSLPNVEKDLHAEFLDTLEDILHKQAAMALGKGLTGDYNATIAKLVLNNAGMVDKQESAVEHSGSIDLTHLSDDQLQAIIDKA